MYGGDPDGYGRYPRRGGPSTFLAIVLLLVLVALVFVMSISKKGASGGAVDGVMDAVSSVASSASGAVSDSALQAEVNRLRSEKLELQAQVNTLKTDKRNADAIVAKTQSEVSGMKAERDAAVSAQAQIQEQYNQLQAVHDDGPKYEKRLKETNGWHLSFGGVVSNPMPYDFKDFGIDPTFTLLAGVGPRRWQFLTGVGYGRSEGLSVSVGFLWTLGGIGGEEKP